VPKQRSIEEAFAKRPIEGVNFMNRRTFLAGAIAAPLALTANLVSACSLVFVNDRKIAKIAVRSMDLPVSLLERPRFVVFPRGMVRDSRTSALPGVKGKIEGVGTDALRWTSKYGSAAVVSFEVAATDGLNEQGLSVHELTLDTSQFEAPDGRPVLPITHWAQYILDSFANVKEVVEAHRAGSFRVAPAWSTDLHIPKELAGVHIAVEDPTGDSAIIEYSKGKLLIHHGPEYRVMTNDPPYDEMLQRMKQYALFGGTKPLPGDQDAEHRFIRLLDYYRYLPDPKNYTEAVAGAMSLLRIAQVPFRDDTRVPGGDQGTFSGNQTNWVTASDLTNLRYYVESATTPSLFWLNVKEASFKPGAPVLALNMHDPSIGGNARKLLKHWKNPG
jgi:penicillin V acylase-like amidase (Ntn superfamily)